MRKERRIRMRVPVHLETTVSSGAKEACVTSKNISLKGMLCTGAQGFEAGDECVAVLELTDRIRVNIRGRVVRAAADRLAIDFTEMDEGSFHHLKKIIEYNAEDPDGIEGELVRPAF